MAAAGARRRGRADDETRAVPHLPGRPRPRRSRAGIPHAPDNYYALYATTTTAQSGRPANDDAVDLHARHGGADDDAAAGPGRAARLPWETLEQPSLAFAYGRIPGTVTLNHWLSLSSAMPHAIPLRDPGTPALRDVDLERIFRRLKEIEMGGEEEDSALHRGLYRHFLRDSEAASSA